MSSIWSGLSGIRAHQLMLDTIGNNLANVETVGFKASRVSFAQMMSQTLREARGGTDTLGGTNPSQVGLGVEVGGISRDFTQGGLRNTGNPLDLAMDGSGFLVLNDGSRNVFSRSATFNVDSNNYLVESVSGYRLTSTAGDDVHVPYDERIAAKKTENVEIVGNLSAGAVKPEVGVLTTTNPFEAGGVAAAATTDLNALDTTSTPYVVGDTIEISGKKIDGTAITPATFTYGVDGATLGDLRDAITAAYAGEATCTLAADGNLTLTADRVGVAKLSLDLSNSGGTGVTDWSSTTFHTVADGREGETRTSSVMVFDSRGEGHVLTLEFQRQTDLTWDMTATLNDTDGTLTKNKITGIQFNADGSFDSVADAGANPDAILIDFGVVAEPQTIKMNFGARADFNGLTQFGGSSTAAATGQDGYEAGVLGSISISRDGKVEGMYTNGEKREIATIQVATFDNPEGLDNVGKNMWARSLNSGDPRYGSAMLGRAGAIASSSLEGSNVEAATELTQLIVAQYGYQLSARTISVSNRINEEMASIIR